jgi:hypothetical protein
MEAPLDRIPNSPGDRFEWSRTLGRVGHTSDGVKPQQYCAPITLSRQLRLTLRHSRSPKAATRPGSAPETCHARLVPRGTTVYGTGLSACILAAINKERRHSADVRQTFSDFFSVRRLLTRLGIGSTFHRDVEADSSPPNTTNLQDSKQLSKPRGQQNPASEEIPRTFALPGRRSEPFAK